MPRIAPADEPYPSEIATALARTMPPGVTPLVLFRTMARNPRVFGKMFAGGLLDKGALSLRQREVVIDRTTARLGAEYEWGVHIAFFAEKVGFDAEKIAATVHGPADAPCWSADEQALLAAVDDLVDHRTIRIRPDEGGATYDAALFNVKYPRHARFKGLVRAVVAFRRMRLRAAQVVYAPGGAGFKGQRPLRTVSPPFTISSLWSHFHPRHDFF